MVPEQEVGGNYDTEMVMERKEKLVDVDSDSGGHLFMSLTKLGVATSHLC